MAQPSIAAVLKALRSLPEATVEDLIRLTGASHPTVLRAISTLEADGLVVRSGYGESRGGRPPVLFRFNRTAGAVVGVEIELPAVRAATLDLGGQVLDSIQWSLDLSDDAGRVMDTLAGLLRTYVDEARARYPVSACGVALTGFIDQGRGLWLGTPRIPALRNVAIRHSLRKALGLPVSISHQIDALTLAEQSTDALRDAAHFLYIDVAEGVGLRHVVDGRPVGGALGQAGLLGHTTVEPRGLACLCGNTGCLEVYASKRALRRLLADAADAEAGGQTEETLSPDSTFQTVLSLAPTHDGARRIADELIGYLAIGIANAVNVFDVPLVVLGGFVTAGGEMLRSRILEESRERLQPVLASGLDLVFARIDRDIAGPVGAGLSVLNDETIPVIPAPARLRR